MPAVHIATDFERWPEVKSLTMSGQLSADQAALTLIRLFLELANLVPVVRIVGFIPDNMLAQLARDVGLPMDALTKGSAPLLHQADGGFLCRRFADSQKHLDPNFRPAHIKGADVSRHRRGLRKFAGNVVAQSLFIPADWMTTDGVAWDDEHARQVMLVIRSFDNALGVPPRASTELGYSRGLLADASALIRREGWERIALVAENLIGLDHPTIPRSTEKLIPRFDEVKTLPEVRAALTRPTT